MPNDCTNHITITSESDIDIAVIHEVEMKSMSITIKQSSKNGIRFVITTAWTPNYSWMESIRARYPSCWIKNEWISEDGTAGVWIGNKDEVKSLEWLDLSIEDEYYIFGQ
jgi:hypothetical protein